MLWEMLEDRPGLDSVVVPVGGGNLIASCLWLAAVLDREVAITGVQSTFAPGTTLSSLNGTMTSAGQDVCRRVGDKPSGSLSAGPSRTPTSETMILVEEHELANAVSYALNNEGVVVEAAAAAGIAALRRFARHVPGEMTGVILTGGHGSPRAISLASCVARRCVSLICVSASMCRAVEEYDDTESRAALGIEGAEIDGWLTELSEFIGVQAER